MNDSLLSGAVDFIAAGPPAFLILWDRTEILREGQRRRGDVVAADVSERAGRSSEKAG